MNKSSRCECCWNEDGNREKLSELSMSMRIAPVAACEKGVSRTGDGGLRADMVGLCEEWGVIGLRVLQMDDSACGRGEDE